MDDNEMPLTPEEIERHRMKARAEFAEGMVRIMLARLAEAGLVDDRLFGEISDLAKRVTATLPANLPRLESEVVMTMLREAVARRPADPNTRSGNDRP